MGMHHVARRTLVALVVAAPLVAQANLPEHVIELGELVQQVVVADVDRDGRPDLLSANSFSQDLVLRHGDGWGGFGPPLSFPAGNDPVALDTGDLNGDGWPDAVVVDSIDDWAFPFLSQGDGTLGSGTPTKVGDRPLDVACVDVDGDGRADALTANTAGGSVSVLLSAPNGLLVDVAPVLAPNIGEFLAAADLSGDGLPELLVPGPGVDEVRVFKNLGGSVFAAGVGHACANQPGPIGLGDLDLDGRLDVVIGGSPKLVGVLLADGLGGFVAGASAPVSLTPQALGVGDLDEDGVADVVAIGQSNGDAKLDSLHGDGAGGLVSFAKWVPGDSSDFVALADVVVDGHLDLLLPDLSDVALLPGDGGGSFAHATRTLIPTSSVSDFDLADVNGDGQADAAVGMWYFDGIDGNTVQMRLSDGAGGLTLAWSDSMFEYPDVARLADFTGDGWLDLAVATVFQTPGHVGLWHGFGNGTFTTSPIMTLTASPWTWDFEVGDVNADGDLDLALALSGTSGMQVHAGNGAGGFASPVSLPLPGQVRSVALGDLDGNGELELVGGMLSPPQLVTWSGHASGSTTVPLLAGAESLDVADLDGDGALDVVTALSGPGTAEILLGDGTGALLSQGAYATGADAHDATLADVDGDDRPDLVLADEGGRAVAVHAGTGGPGFGAVQTHCSGTETYFVEVGDLDGDGRADLTSGVQSFGTGYVNAHLQAAPSPFTLVPGGAAGKWGVPLLRCDGPLLPGSPFATLLRGAGAGLPVAFVVGLSPLLASFKGGVLVPDADALILAPPTDAQGALTLAGPWPGVPSGLTFWLQAWLPDPAAAKGWAGSNGVKLAVP
jgi:FG-GAP-like repeat